jgi:alpha-glucosidase (family GH31 glycosyl hydrolase)
MSTNNYGIFFHTSHATTWDMGSTDPTQYSFTAKGGELDYYFIQGEKFPEILEGYTNITGTSPLLPKFALGLHVGTYSGGTWGHEEKTSTTYVVDLVKRFRQLQIPLDVLHLDSTWRIFGENGGKGATSFEWRETFDNPKAMFDSLYAMDLNMVGLHLRPRFDNGKKLRLLDAAQKQGFVYPEKDSPGEFVNFFDPEAVDWWWENGVKRVAEQGAMFLKTDEGSAFGHKANESNKTGPTGKEIDSLHNLFPLVYAKAPYEKFAEYNGMRGMNQTREGYAGIQRYPYIFAGDWPSEWQYFEPVIKAGLNIGISGVGNWAHCMGGFEHVADPELYIRWCQFGLLSPVAHLFGMEHPNYKEPWNYGEEALTIFKQYDQMRYGLIPYLYSHSYEMYQTGMPLMRALVLAYQDDPNVYEITDQYLLGESMMVCPVTTKGAQTRVVYLPEGKWIDYWTGTSHEGKSYLNVVCPIEQIPIFIKAGAIIPTQEPLNFIGEREIKEITLDIYPGGESTFHLYDDDGRTTAYQNGQYSITEILSSNSSTGAQITIKAPKGKFKVTKKDYFVKVHLEERPAQLKVNGKNFPIVEESKIDGSKAIYDKGVLRFPITDIKGNTEIQIQKKS